MQPFQFGIVQADFSQMAGRIVQIFRVWPAPANSLRNDLRLFFQRQPAAILFVGFVNDINDRLHPAAVRQIDVQGLFQIS